MRVTVYAGSSTGRRPVYERAARAFGRRLAEAGAEIVCGGGGVGLMAALADGALSAGGKVIGVMPDGPERQTVHPALSELHVVASLEERKRLMLELGDCCVALPGGIGTLDELFDAWLRLVRGEHAKPVTVLDVDGYWHWLLRTVHRMSIDDFARPGEVRALAIVQSAADLLALYDSWRPPLPRWSADDLPVR